MADWRGGAGAGWYREPTRSDGTSKADPEDHGHHEGPGMRAGGVQVARDSQDSLETCGELEDDRAPQHVLQDVPDGLPMAVGDPGEVQENETRTDRQRQEGKGHEVDI